VDVESFEGWYRAHYARLLGALRVRCGDEVLAREGLDEACSRAVERWDRVGTMAHPAGWVYRVALNQIRRMGRRRTLEAALVRRQVSPTPLEVSTDVELWASVRELPGRQRDVIVLRYLADLPESEVAAWLGITRGAVSASAAKARSALALSLGQQSEEVRP